MQIIKIGNIIEDEWLSKAKAMLDNSNIICITQQDFKNADYNPLIWFGTNLAHFLAKNGESEICPLFGKNIHTLTILLINFVEQSREDLKWGET